MVTAQRVMVSCLVWLSVLSYAPAQAGSGTVQGQRSTSKKAGNPPEDRLGWFREAKFGMFIHWGPYSVLGGEWRGKQMPVPGGEVDEDDTLDPSWTPMSN